MDDEQRHEIWPIERLRPYEHNPRIVPPAAVTKLAASIREFGFKGPIIVDRDGVVIAGHTRLLAAKQVGLGRLPVIVADDLTSEQAKAFRLADNRLAQETSWDDDLLADELAGLLELNVDLGPLGFDESELAKLLEEPSGGLTDPDEVPAAATPRAQRGELYRCGAHRLLCGDATDRDDVERLMDGRRAALMATDPPYLCNYDGGNHPQSWDRHRHRIAPAEKTKHWDAYRDQEAAVEFYRAFLHTACEGAVAEAAPIYQSFAVMRSEIVWAAWRAVGLHPHQVLIWAKSRAVLTRADYLWDYEPILYGWRSGQRPLSARRPPADAHAVWQIDSTIEDGAAGIHPTQKPVELVRRPILYHTRPSELIYEPFAGSGTALIAAEMTGRACAAIELSPAFVDVAVARWEAFTGKRAVCE